jgi:nucleoside-diphosphate-sugar epimerase
MADLLRIAVTGGSGGVGRFVVRHLLERGHTVVNLDRKPGDDDRARFVECDIRQRQAIAPVLADCDGVCHLAEIPNPYGGVPLDEIYWNNTQAASVVLHAAAELGLKHAVYASTCQVYGCWGWHRVVPIRFPIDETYPVQPMNVYAVSKVANELFAQNLAREKEKGMRISIFRFPWVMKNDFDGSAAEKWASQDAPWQDGFGTFVHGSDLARAFAAALETNLPGCNTYNIGAPDVLSVAPLQTRLKKHHPDYPLLPAGWPDHKSPLITEKAQKMLGWKPLWSFAEYFRE